MGGADSCTKRWHNVVILLTRLDINFSRSLPILSNEGIFYILCLVGTYRSSLARYTSFAEMGLLRC